MSRHHDGLYYGVAWHEWERVRRRVFDRDGWRCQSCGKLGKLECDHVRALQDGGALLDMANLQALCRPCHFDKTAGEYRRYQRRVMGPARAAWHEWIEQTAEDIRHDDEAKATSGAV